MKPFEIFGTTWTVAIAPSCRATCCECKEKIIQGDKRLEVSQPSSFGGTRTSFVCKKCISKFLHRIQKEFTKVIKEIVINKKLLMPIKKSKYPFADMSEVGSSTSMGRYTERKRVNIGMAAVTFHKTSKRRFTIKNVNNNLIIWRTK